MNGYEILLPAIEERWADAGLFAEVGDGGVLEEVFFEECDLLLWRQVPALGVVVGCSGHEDTSVQ